MLPDLERVERIGEFWSYPQSRTFAELLIDCEERPDATAALDAITGNWQATDSGGSNHGAPLAQSRFRPRGAGGRGWWVGGRSLTRPA